MSITRDTVSCAFPNAPAVEISELTVGYVPGVPVLEKLSFRTSAPLVHLCGGNGSGKSTVVEVLGGTLQPWGGSLTIFGEPPFSHQARARRRISRAEPALIPVFTVRMHVELLCAARGLDERCLFERLSKYALNAWLDVPVGELSTGNLRRAWLVLSTARPASLMVLDEPFNGLDTEGVEIVAEEISEWLAEDRTILLIAHTLPGPVIPQQRIELPARKEPH